MKAKLISLQPRIETAAPTQGAGAVNAAGLPPNPFVGLRPFKVTEDQLFFGRYRSVAELLQMLHETRFLSIVGSSGCGKSSLIYAGLLPKLKAGFLANDRTRWHVAMMKPGDAPLRNFVLALLKAFNLGRSERHVRLFLKALRRSGFRAVARFLAWRLRKSDGNFFLLVDQFEELFRFGLYADEGEAAAEGGATHERRAEAADFVAFMLELARQKDLPAYVVMTMRSDFVGDCDAFHGLPEAMNRSQYLVPRLTRQQRREAIESPVRLYGAGITTRLVDRVLNDVGDEPDQLPIMQHALMRTWECWRVSGDRELDTKHYEETGTFRGALSQHADQALEGMSERETVIARRIFQALTEVDAKGRRLRRPVYFSQLVAITGATHDEVQDVINRFRGDNRSFLHVAEVAPDGDPLVDISHESLIRQWVKLGDWVKDEVKSREQYLRLAGDAERYYNPEKRWVALWSDPALQLALKWWVKRQPNEAWARRYHEGFALTKKFLYASFFNRVEEERRAAEAQRRDLLAAQDLAEARQRELVAAQNVVKLRDRNNRLLRFAIFILSSLVLLFAATAVYAYRAQARAKEQEAVAVAKEAEVAELYRAQRETTKQIAIERDKTEEARKKEEAAKNAALDAQKDADEAKKLAEAAAVNAERERQNALDALGRLKVSRAEAAAQQEVDELRRQAGKEQEAVKIEQARNTYLEVAKRYAAKPLNNRGGAAYTYAELGKMLLEQPPTGPVYGDQPARRSPDETAEASDNRRDWVKDVLLSDERPETPFPRLGLTAEQTTGLRYYATAINAYRAIGDHNGSAAALDKIGGFLMGDDAEDACDTEFVDEPVSKARELAGGSSLCAALGDYEKAQNLEGQISMLTKFGDRLLTAASADGDSEEEADEEEDDSTSPARPTPRPTPASAAGCSGRGSDGLTYLEQTPRLYYQLVEQKGQTPEQMKSVRGKLIDALVKIGGVYLGRDDDAAALAKFKEAARVDLNAAAEVLVNAGHSKTEGALKSRYYEIAAQLYRDAGKFKEEAGVFRSVGGRYSQASRRPGVRPNDPRSIVAYRTAVAYYNQAVAVYQKSGDPEAREAHASVLRSLGSAHLTFVKLDEALAAYELSLKLSEAAGSKGGQGSSYYGIGRVQERKGQIDEAKESYRKAAVLAGEASGSENKFMKDFAERAVRRLNAPKPTPTPVDDSPGQRPGVTPTPKAIPELEDADLDADLAGEGDGGVTGDLDYKVEDGHAKFGITLLSTKLPPGTKLVVTIGDWKETVTLGPSGSGELDLKSRRGQTLPPVAAGTKVTVTDETGRVVASGTVVDEDDER